MKGTIEIEKTCPSKLPKLLFRSDSIASTFRFANIIEILVQGGYFCRTVFYTVTIYHLNKNVACCFSRLDMKKIWFESFWVGVQLISAILFSYHQPLFHFYERCNIMSIQHCYFPFLNSFLSLIILKSKIDDVLLVIYYVTRCSCGQPWLYLR